MKTFFLPFMALALISSSSALASDMALEIPGFKVLESNNFYIKLQFRDDAPFVISKARYNNTTEGSEFCESLGLHFDVDGFDKATLLAFAGARELSPTFKQALNFRYENEGVTTTGFWAWRGSNNDISMMVDGHNYEPETSSISEIQSLLDKAGQGEKASLPIFCK